MSSKLVQKQGRNNPCCQWQWGAVYCQLCELQQGHSPAQSRGEARPHHSRAEPSAVPELCREQPLPPIPFSPSHVPSQHFCPPGLSDEQHLPQAGFRGGRQPVWTEIFPLAASPAMQGLGVCPAPGVQHRGRRHHCSLLPPTQPLCKWGVSVLVF